MGDPLLFQQWQDFLNDEESFEFSSMYKGCHEFLSRMNGFIEEDVFTCAPAKRKELLSKEIFLELTQYWNRLEAARITHTIHDAWQPLCFHGAMFRRYTHCVYH